MGGVPVVDEIGLHLPGRVAEPSHPGAGVVGEGSPEVLEHVLAVRGETGVADQDHLGAVRQLVVDPLQNVLGGLPDVAHPGAGRIDLLLAGRGIAHPQHEALLDDVGEPDVVAADGEHRHVRVRGHALDLTRPAVGPQQVVGDTSAVREVGESGADVLLVQPVHVVVRPAVATAVGALVVSVVVAGAVAGRVGVAEKGHVDTAVGLDGRGGGRGQERAGWQEECHDQQDRGCRAGDAMRHRSAFQGLQGVGRSKGRGVRNR